MFVPAQNILQVCSTSWTAPRSDCQASAGDFLPNFCVMNGGRDPELQNNVTYETGSTYASTACSTFHPWFFKN